MRGALWGSLSGSSLPRSRGSVPQATGRHDANAAERRRMLIPRRTEGRRGGAVRFSSPRQTETSEGTSSARRTTDATPRDSPRRSRARVVPLGNAQALDRAPGAWAMSLSRWFSRGGARASSSGDPPGVPGPSVSERSVAERRTSSVCDGGLREGLGRRERAAGPRSHARRRRGGWTSASTRPTPRTDGEAARRTPRTETSSRANVRSRAPLIYAVIYLFLQHLAPTSPSAFARHVRASPFDRVDRPGATRSRVRRDARRATRANG